MHVRDSASPTRRRGTDNEVSTSQRIATSVNTNPVVIRRCLSELRRAGLVSSSRSAGWSLTRDASKISLLDVHTAVGGDEVFGMHASSPDAACYVGYGIQAVLTRVYQRAADALCASLSTTSIADILRDTMAEFETSAGLEIHCVVFAHPSPPPRTESAASTCARSQ